MNKSSQLGSVSSSDLIDAKLEEHQLCGSKHCPGCGHKLEGKPDWVGLPAGVKFDPTDQELIEHLEAKVEGKESKSHPLIDEFIPTIEGEDGICYTHPEKLPGVTRDGLSRHFFHRPSKAYTTGTRKRRKIQTESTYKAARRGGIRRAKREAGHGQHEEEKEGELVVSKIFYQTQPRQCNWSERSGGVNIGGAGEGNSVDRTTAEEIVAVVIGPPPMQTYSAIDIQQLKADHFSFLPFRKSFDEAGNIGEASIAREVGGGGTCEEPTAFHISRPSHSISTIISPPPVLHHTSINILDEDHSFHVPRIILLMKITRSASGLEELIMGCTSTDIKEESSMANPQEAEWLKYSTSFWPDPDNPDHHG
ncbi:hypothetical protein DH2020_014523 [Rehmannia glutinosa]|uniref:NAC domain-containing protein n=1 Tax=Rehmannia glutinosa TaxID=99300 RepID=A0ABR0WWP0_REHGL